MLLTALTPTILVRYEHVYASGTIMGTTYMRQYY